MLPSDWLSCAYGRLSEEQAAYSTQDLFVWVNKGEGHPSCSNALRDRGGGQRLWVLTQTYVIWLASTALLAWVQKPPPPLRMWPLPDPVNPPEWELFTFFRLVSSYWTRTLVSLTHSLSPLCLHWVLWEKSSDIEMAYGYRERKEVRERERQRQLS